MSFSKLYFLVVFSLVTPQIFGQFPDDFWVVPARIEDSYQAQNLVSTDSSGMIPGRNKQLFHSAFQPYSNRDYKSFGESTFLTKSAQSVLQPIMDFSGGWSKNIGLAGFNSLGLVIRHHSKNEKWNFFGGYTGVIQRGPSYLTALSVDRGVIAGVGRSIGLGDSLFFAHNPFGRVVFQANKYFQIETGFGKNFWGDGFRSLILSDNAASYPYLRAQIDVWRLRFNSLYGAAWQNEGTKFFAAHGISFNPGKKIQLTFFEMVVWQQRDSLNNRTTELHYLHPLVFYRPVEYAQGSADNVLLGTGFKWALSKKFELYGQFILDEFLLSQIRARNGWWGNKFGGQLGFKWNKIIEGLSVQCEGNCVRPFTYSHGSPLQSWSHLYQPLAHPLGANFLEGLLRVKYAIGSWNHQLTSVFALVGRDLDMDGDDETDNLGGNILRSYASPYRDFENKLLQGNRTERVFVEWQSAFQPENWKRLELFGRALLVAEKNQLDSNNEVFLQFGIRTRGLLEISRFF